MDQTYNEEEQKNPEKPQDKNERAGGEEPKSEEPPKGEEEPGDPEPLDDGHSKGLLSVEAIEFKELPLGKEMDWFKQAVSRFVAGGAYLIAGQPGIGKSTLTTQIALDLSRAGKRTLIIQTEQRKEELRHTVTHMTKHWPAEQQKQALRLIEPENGIESLDQLPLFFAKEIASTKGRYHGVSMVVIDSVQGNGLSSAATKQYNQLNEFCQLCKAEEITVFLVAHVTKSGDISGPKDFEHNVDCVLMINRLLRGSRPTTVTKNRFGYTSGKIIPLEIDKETRWLKLSPYNVTANSVARTYLGPKIGVAEVQVMISLPPPESKGSITTQIVAKKGIQQLMPIIAQILDAEHEQLRLAINCKMPRIDHYSPLADMATGMALTAAYIHKDIPEHFLFLGQIDLQGKVRDVPGDLLRELLEQIKAGHITLPLRIYCPKEVAAQFLEQIEDLEIVGCEQFEDAVFDLWPDLRK